MRPPMRPSVAAALLLLAGLGATAPAAETPHAPASSAPSQPVTHGESAAYEALGQLPTMHEGRVKPLDTVAREEIKQIYTRETIKFRDAEGKVIATWSPVAAFLDWSVRPKFWDDQPIIAVEYLPLKRKILAEDAHEALEAVASKSTTPPATRTRLEALAHLAEVDAGEVRDAVRDSGLPEEDGKSLLALAARLGEETKWMTPGDLENARVTVDGKVVPFFTWLGTLSQKSGEVSESAMGAKPKLPDIEEKALEVAMRIAHYRSIRDKAPEGQFALLVMPRPANDAMLAFTAKAVELIRDKGQGREAGLTPLEGEAAKTLAKYFGDISVKDQAIPGTNAEFDARYKSWVADRSAWLPLNVVRESTVDELTRAGFPGDRIQAFRAAFDATEQEELLHPGQADQKTAFALLDSAHTLGAIVSPNGYPSVESMAREVRFNDFAPFLKAPLAYLAGLVLLILNLVASSLGKSMNLESSLGKVSKGLYLAGIAGFAAGIALEVYGFYLRVRITGWAPVSNMYETVIWVALVASVLGLIYELVSRRTVVAIGASIVALLGTGLAATVPLLDPTIGSLPPVLRSNYWLTIHVLTIVSSYAAFALAMGLGLVATTTYLVATYKRSATFSELITPLAVGIPILGIGTGLAMKADQIHLGPLWASYGYYAAWVVAAIGGVFCGMSGFAILGEIVNRVFLARQLRGTETLAPDPSVYANTSHHDEARALSMQRTASHIKPMANFIYRSMQVGILLVAAGTFLGGWWADVSWGRFWGWDPKEVWALITLLVYLMPLHGRFAGWVNTFWLVMSSVVCFLSVLMAWYGVNFVLGVGLHSYGFTNGGGQGSVAVVTLVVLAFAAGTFWRRRVSSRVGAIA